jgi:hypothetical protein
MAVAISVDVASPSPIASTTPSRTAAPRVCAVSTPKKLRTTWVMSSGAGMPGTPIGGCGIPGSVFTDAPLVAGTLMPRNCQVISDGGRNATPMWQT